MKSVAVILVVALVYVNAVEQDEVLQQWAIFQAEFGKTYRSPVEASKRFAIFQSNLELIEAHNHLHQKGLTTFTMGTNQFTDWTQDEFKNYVKGGLFNGTRIQGEVFVETPGFEAPESLDWRKEGIVTAVKDQGSCGGCWAFSSTGSLEGQLAQKNGKLISLSEQNLIDCSKNGGNEGCNGGLMTLAFDYVIENGIASEEDYPFTGRDGKCKQEKTETKISSYVNIPEGNENALAEALVTKGPISVGMDASSIFFQLYSGGIYSAFCSSTSLDHAILAVGYGSENGQEFYIIKNSWGTSWGEDGYFRLPRNNNNKCGVASMATYPQL